MSKIVNIHEAETHFFVTLPVHLRHAFRAGALPDLHRDPFDRFLIAQGVVERLPVLTSAPLFRGYPVEVLWD